MPHTQTQGPALSWEQIQALATAHTDGLRDGADALHDGPPPAPATGRISDPLPHDPEPDVDEVESPRDRPPDPLSLRHLLGAKRPRVCLRVRQENGTVVVVPAFTPRPDSTAAAALGLFQVQLEVVLRGWLKKHPADAALLLHGDGGTPADRRRLLDRLAVKPGEKVGDPSGTAHAPNNLGLERYAVKFATFPDGTAFSLRLLFRDDRGRPMSPEHPLSGRTDDEVRAAVGELLRRERTARVAVNDEEFGKRLFDYFEEAGQPLPESPTDKQVARLRTQLGHDAFPTVTARRKRYKAEAGE